MAKIVIGIYVRRDEFNRLLPHTVHQVEHVCSTGIAAISIIFVGTNECLDADIAQVNGPAKTIKVGTVCG